MPVRAQYDDWNGSEVGATPSLGRPGAVAYQRLAEVARRNVQWYETTQVTCNGKWFQEPSQHGEN